jgi:putative DNA primase/helicase
MVPPSIHPTSDERLEWAEHGEPTAVESITLLQAVGTLAAAALVGRYWPTNQRHLAALALAGGLARAGWSKREVVRFVAAVSAAAQDEESQDRARAAEDTYNKLAHKDRATGWPTLRKMMGDRIVDRISEWLGLNQNHQHELMQGDVTLSEAERLDWTRTLSVTPELSDDPAPLGYDVTPPEYADDAIALRFSQRYGDDLRYTALWGRWRRWDGTRWRQDDTLVVFDLIRKYCRLVSAGCEDDKLSRRLTSAETVYAVERLIRADRRHAATVEQWDSDPLLLNTPAGTVDLRTGTLHAHRREDYCTKMTAASSGGPCPRWKEFLNRVTADNPELQDYLQRMFGYCLTGLTREHALFFLYGSGANGKSVFVNTFAGLLGDYSAIAPAEAFLASHFERHPTDLAGLRGARLVTAIETEQGRRWAEAKIKSITGGDPVTARFMRQDFFQYVPQFKLVIAGNHKPGLRSVDEAIRRRLHLIPFTVTIPPEERDLELPDRLREEWGGILQLAIEGCNARGCARQQLCARQRTSTWLQKM